MAQVNPFFLVHIVIQASEGSQLEPTCSNNETSECRVVVSNCPHGHFLKGRWEALGNLAPERLSALKRIATIESVGSSTRIEGAKLCDDEIERLLSGLDVSSFRSRDDRCWNESV